jgi:peptidoglycan/LPS O-acetylase OafA/YrhL
MLQALIRSGAAQTGAPAAHEPRVVATASLIDYAPFVDGLRAIAILAVVAFHVGVPGAAGGFVGVDVFFVISGFLIINQIKQGLASGKFSILTFYAHRSLRILPPFLVMVALTDLIAAFILPTPSMAHDYVLSALTVPAMLSNIAFLLSQGYFDISAIEKPLLHTWTLSVEEQFYFFAPVLLILVFVASGRRFGPRAGLIGGLMLAVSLAGAIHPLGAHGEGAAFYLPYYRAWEFIGGGLIGGGLVAMARCLPRAVLELLGWIGLACIGGAIVTFHADMAYPSYYAALPVAGAFLVILCGLADPALTAARCLALRPMVAVGLVSYGWYLWHWPILSFLRIARMDQPSLLPDAVGAGVVAFVLACLSYRYLEQPIRRWRKSPRALRRPGRIVAGAVAACVALALVGGAGAYAAYAMNSAYVAARYQTQGRGTLDNGCEHIPRAGLPDKCFEAPSGMLLGDSHASVLEGAFARSFDALGLRLVSIAGPGCHPLAFVPTTPRQPNWGECAYKLVPFERLLATKEPLRFAIISANWGFSDQFANDLAALIARFDPRTRILLIGQVPVFPRSGLECVVLSDRYRQDRDSCVVARRTAEVAGLAEAFAATAAKFANVRYVDPLAAFCDNVTCRPFDAATVLFLDAHHVTPSGADRIYDTFKPDFLWLTGGDG